MFNLLVELVEQQFRIESMCADVIGCFDDPADNELYTFQMYERQIAACFYSNLYSVI